MVDIECRENSTMTNPVLLKIRYAALDRAFGQIRGRRLDLDESRNNGWISEEEYQQQLVNLILESNQIRSEQKEIEGLLGR